MAEGFAKTYGRDVMIPKSAGLSPATAVIPTTRKVMLTKNIDLGDVFPKGIEDHGSDPFDLVVNISGYPLPSDMRAPSREWKVKDPMGLKEKDYVEAANQIERLVMDLILELRQLQKKFHKVGKPKQKSK